MRTPSGEIARSSPFSSGDARKNTPRSRQCVVHPPRGDAATATPRSVFTATAAIASRWPFNTKCGPVKTPSPCDGAPDVRSVLETFSPPPPRASCASPPVIPASARASRVNDRPAFAAPQGAPTSPAATAVAAALCSPAK
eukprot:31006-Pelagococcus_subviridis.AAC.12